MRVYDYADLNVPMLARMFDRRCRGYEALGYKLMLLLARFLDGQWKYRCRSILYGRKTTQAVSDAWFATGSIRR